LILGMREPRPVDFTSEMLTKIALVNS
jgi:hypothetical protein